MLEILFFCPCPQISVPLEADPSQQVGFRKLLLNKCQQEFEKDKAEQLDIEKIQKLIDEAESVSASCDCPCFIGDHLSCLFFNIGLLCADFLLAYLSLSMFVWPSVCNVSFDVVVNLCSESSFF